MTEIRDKVFARAKVIGAKPEDIKSNPNAQILVRDESDAGSVHILVNPNAPLDKIQAKAPGMKLSVEASDDVDLGKELGGNWKHFVLSGLDKAPDFAPDADRRVNISLIASGEKLPEATEFTTLDLGFLANMLHGPLNKAEPQLRGVKGKTVDVTPELRKLIGTYLKRHVDDVVPLDLVNTVLAAHQKQNLAFLGALESMSNLGIFPTFQPKAPQVVVDKSVGAEVEGPLSQKATEWLTEQGRSEIPESADADAWGELFDFALDNNVPNDVAEELSRAMVRAEDEAKQIADAGLSAFSQFLDEEPAAAAGTADVEEEPQQSVVLRNESEAAQARKYVADRVQKGLGSLGLGDDIIRKATSVIHAATLQPAQTPSLIIVAGPTSSPADQVATLAETLTSKGAIRISGGADLAKSGFGAVFGHNDGGPTTQGARLTDEAIADQRSGGRKVAVVIDDLFDIGIDGREDARDAAMVSWMVRVADAMKTGKMNVFVDGEPKNVNLADTVFIMRARRDPADLLRVIDENVGKNRDLAILRDSIIGVSGDPEQNVKSLEATLGSELKHIENATVTLGDDLRQRVLSIFTDEGSITQVKQWMSEALADATRTLPGKSFTVELKGRREGLTEKARDKVFEGAFFGAGNPFKVSTNVGGTDVELPFENTWRDVKDELDYYRGRTEQLEQALAQAARAATKREP